MTSISQFYTKIRLKRLFNYLIRDFFLYNCRVMGSVWVLFLLSSHTNPIYLKQPVSWLQLLLSNAH